MKALIVHNSDQAKACFVSRFVTKTASERELVDKVMKSKYGPDILERLNDSREAEDFTVDESNITLTQIASLHHDGDSEDGYTLMDAN